MTRLTQQSFRNANLAHADFHGRDIRGIDFTGAVLTEADFSYAKAGLPQRWLVGMAAATLFIALFAGVVAGFASAVWSWLNHSPTNAFTAAHQLLLFFVGMTVLIVSLGILLRRGLGIALGVFAMSGAVMTGLAATMTTPEITSALLILFGLGIGPIITSIVLLAGTILTANGIEQRQWPLRMLGSPQRHPTLPLRQIQVRNLLGLLCLVTAALGAGAGMWEGIHGFDTDKAPSAALTWPVTLAVSIVLIFLMAGLFMSRNAIDSDVRFVLIRRFVISLLTAGGTKFRRADLTQADFSHATLDHSDFRDAVLLRTEWQDAESLDRARTDHTYLADPIICHLVTSKNGRHGCFDQRNLIGVNLGNADLVNASFVGTDLSKASLRRANLTGAKLVQSQLHGTDLREATLTGAFFENWAISTDTRIDSIQCDFIYTRLPTPTDPDPWRKPDNRQEIFKAGDFEDFIAPIIKTLDLYRQQHVDPRVVNQLFRTMDLFHHNDIDPAASAAALQRLAEQYPDANLQLVAVEGRGTEKLRLQVVVAAEADRAHLSERYNTLYHTLAAQVPGVLSTASGEIPLSNPRMRQVQDVVYAATQNSTFYIQTNIRLGQTLKSVILAANPVDAPPVRLDIEIREITAMLRTSHYRDVIELIPVFAARPDDLLQALNQHMPQIVHFSGHGTPAGEILLLDDQGRAKPVSAQRLVQLFQVMKDNVQLVLLNTCYAQIQAESITNVIDCAIGMTDAITEEGAIKFVAAFYRAIGFGRSIQAAFEQGITALALEGIPEEHLPRLMCKPGVDPTTVVLITPHRQTI